MKEILAEHERFQAAATKGKWAWQKLGGDYHLVGQYGKRPIILSASSHNRTPYITNLVDGLLARLEPDHPDSVFIEESRMAWPATTRALRAAIKIIDTVVTNPVLRDELMAEIQEAYDA
mgnify:CR=1 FL=1